MPVHFITTGRGGIVQTEVMGIPTYYEQFGEKGSPLLVLHGWGSDVAAMMPVIQRLKKYHRVTAVDFPAHGGTGMISGDWTVPDFAKWTETFIRQQNLEGCHVLAHSFGGRVALYLAANTPSLFQRVILTGSAGLVKEKTAADRRRAAKYRLGRAGLSFLSHLPVIKDRAKGWLQAYRDKHNSADYKALPEQMRATFNNIIKFDSRKFLPRVKNPTLLLWGQQDTETPLWMAEAFRAGIAGSRLSIMPGGHFAFLSYPDVFCDYVLDFLEEEHP